MAEMTSGAGTSTINQSRRVEDVSRKAKRRKTSKGKSRSRKLRKRSCA